MSIPGTGRRVLSAIDQKKGTLKESSFIRQIILTWCHTTPISQDNIHINLIEGFFISKLTKRPTFPFCMLEQCCPSNYTCTKMWHVHAYSHCVCHAIFHHVFSIQDNRYDRNRSEILARGFTFFGYRQYSDNF